MIWHRRNEVPLVLHLRLPESDVKVTPSVVYELIMLAM